MSSTFWITGLSFIILGFTAFIPYMTRKTENFGVSIPESMYHRADFKQMRKMYTFIMLIILVLFIALLTLVSFYTSEKVIYIVYIISIFLYLISGFLVYLPFYNKMKNIKRSENWQLDKQPTLVVDTNFRQEKLTISYFWYIIPFIICVITWGFTWIWYDQIPDQVPIHNDLAGNITYSDKTVGTVVLLPFTQLFLFITFLFVHYIINVSKQQTDAENPKVSIKQNILYRRRWSIFMLISGTITILLFSFMQLTFIYPSLIKYEDIVVYVTIGIILIGTIVLSIVTGQGGSRINIDKPMNEEVMDRDEDHHWKLGQFYFNKDDPALFIEKRFGVGWTNNWARPMSWILLLLVLLLAFAPLLLIFI